MLRRMALVVGVLVVVGAAVLAVHVIRVHHRYWEWALAPSVSPPKIEVAGRDYRRAGPVAAVDPALVVIAAGPGDGVVYGPGDRSRTPTVVVLRTAGTGAVGYSLMGGP